MPDILVQGRDGFFSAYQATARTGSGPGIVLIQEIFGVNRVMRDLADTLAEAGYTVLCPDLFWRQEPNIQLNDFTPDEWKTAFSLYQGFDEAKGVEDIEATIRHLRRDPACTGRVGAVGYCLGGKLAYLAATRTDADCSVGYYGVGIENALGEADNIRRPLMLHIARKDQFVPPEAQDRIHRALDAHSRVTLFDYEGCDHAFAREGGDHYDADAAALANARTADFFRRHLLEPPAMPETPARPVAPKPAAPKPAASRPAARKAAAPKPAAPKAAAPKAAAPKPKAAAARKAARKPAQKKPARKPAARKPAAKKAAAKKPAARKPAGSRPAAKAKAAGRGAGKRPGKSGRSGAAARRGRR
jgi:carboxymethylenebutenolidase